MREAKAVRILAIYLETTSTWYRSLSLALPEYLETNNIEEAKGKVEGVWGEEAQAIIEGASEGVRENLPDDIRDAILTLNALAGKLRKKRFASGAISFDRPEMKVEVDEKGRPVNVYQ